MVKRRNQSGGGVAWGGRRAQLAFAVVLWFALPGCQTSPTRYPQTITAADPLVRIRAIIQAGDTQDQNVVPLLVDRLEDEDPGVRFYAILSLDRICGTRLGYDYSAPEEVRLEAVRRWRERIGTKSPPTEANAAVLPTE